MIEIFLDRTSNLDVDVKVNGSNGKSFEPEVRLCLIKEGMRISFPAVLNENNSYSVSVPSLAGKLKAGNCEMEVEVVVDGKYFVPIKGTASLKEDIKPIAEIKSSKLEDKITLTANVRESIQEVKPKPVVKKKQEIIPSQLIKKNIVKRHV
jgi:hypothetical protein